MSFEEKSAWIMGVLAVGSGAVYLAIVLPQVGTRPIVEVPYIAPMLWCIGASIALSILLHTIVSSVARTASGRKAAREKDERDREIYRLGEHVGQSFLVIGGVAALLMAMIRMDQFWIANAIFLAFVLSAVLGSTTKIVAYRRGFQTW
ncbi:hypothetical protein [Cryobacterium fucosi]|uniref:DUF2178 domain-containing protein n=1 Tax=Cryobacterium fucosi TaxID=1259157 RepID=A0A4R9B490_9MICO|nr:hypothetical protein [Cryobacterium fucosi]TFD74367.1 hypothetical protein E3T48_13615 [Cryobacterium fucosi]